jgi:mannose-6-phosphate isomerase-like protein (cupin superfamily)
MAERFDSVRILKLEKALKQLPGLRGDRFAEVFRHGSLQIEIYAPTEHDHQSPHSRDEVYVVIQGRSFFNVGEQREKFGSGDVLFAPAHVSHKFEDFGLNLIVWVLFYGPEGGERENR